MNCILDMHCHTIASGHAYSTLQEIVSRAKQKGLKLVGISDHAPAMPGTAHIFYFANLKVIPKVIDDIRVLKGVEANIIDYDGNIDMTERDLRGLDYAIASMHTPCLKPSSIEENTKAIIKAMDNPYIKIIGHPDDSRYPLDYEKIVKYAKERKILLEVNNSSLRPEALRKNAMGNVMEYLKLCKEYEVPVIFSSDAHISFDVGNFQYCKEVARMVDFPEELVVNASIEYLSNYINVLL